MRELLILLLACLNVAQVDARTWRYRSGDGASLQAVINGTAAGDTVLVEGTVSEGSIRVDRPLVLLGGADAVIDGGGEDDALLITADHVTVKGFTIRGSRRSNLDDMSGIKVNECRGVVIADNFIDKCFFAIYLSGVKDALIEGNTVLGEPGEEDHMANGIHLWKCSKATIRNNRIENHRDGIYFEFVTDSHITGNTSLHNLRYGLHFMFSHRDAYEDNHFEDNGAGVAVMFSKEIAMRRNRFLANRGASAYGLLLKEINDGEIEDNTFQDNTTGIMIDGCNRINVHDNEFRLNGWALRLFANAIDCDFRGNTFAGNTFDVSTNGSLIPNTMNGNYWDRYRGYDLNRDGVGDVPHAPVRLFALVVERAPSALLLVRSAVADALDLLERIAPALTPAALLDQAPRMRPLVRAPSAQFVPAGQRNERAS